ncbi:ABC transporter ATP-binding protein [[Bacillus] enclensis]|uniref:ABC transporter ATP-binding protein n=1 Tax=[Bacillus] enclensis TaxID=1402860 RepID=UPI0018DDA2B0|nr:ABC transporter ATP-binding protein [[Bacillus] enclensis]MBH9966529.1 ABC transporter ATP-binding protein [[Bacillus] enclensis]
MKVGKRLVDYALLYKKIIIAALLMLTFSVAAELAGPFIAKKMIDDHILGIEAAWYETDKGKDAISYKGEWYKREQYFNDGEQKGKEVRILQIGREFYFVPAAISFDGERRVKGKEMMITKGKESKSYPAQKLGGDELLDFYSPEIPRIMKLIAFYFGLLVVASFFQYGQRFYLQKAANRVIQKMRNDIFQHIQKLPIRYFDNLPAGKVVARITNDTEAIRDLYVTVLSTFFTSTIYILGIYIALFILDVKLAAICLILIPILVIWTYLYRIYASKYNHIIRSKVSDINAMINESIQGMNIIQAFSREKQTSSEFEEMNGTHYKYQNKLLSLNSMTSHNLVGVLRNITFVAFIWYFGGGSIGVGSVVTLGVLYAFVDYINRLFQPVTGIVNQLANLEQALVAGERVFSLLDEDGTKVVDDKMARYQGNVSFEHVFFGYKENEYVLKDITFEANQGETVALVGHTGSGKSSIMNLLFRFYDANEGKIMIDGQDIKDIPYQTIREHMGIVLQDPYLFTGTIASNVSLDDTKISRETVEAALKAVGAERVFKNLEKGYDEPVIEKGSTLSSGQRQLISFARALAFNPAILILDEATSSIDTETEAVIQEAMEVLKKGRTTFIIAHRLSTIKNADQILVLDRGEIVEKGNHDELMKAGGRYYQMYELQQGSSDLAG